MPIPTEKQIPGRSSLRASLRKVTEALLEEIQAPTKVPPAWTEFEWGIARAAVTIHGIAGILIRGLRWSEPVHWRDFLAAQVSESHDQQQLFAAALGDIDRLAVEAGIPVMMLKGCALHALGIYQAGERPMADIDLLVRPGDVQAMDDLLGRAGFIAGGSSWKNREFERSRGSGCVKLDLHTRLVERMAGRFIELPSASFGTDRGGLRGYESKAAMMRHLLFHTAGNMSRRWVRAIQLHDIALLATHLEPMDWQALRSRDWPDRWCIYPPLLLASRYFARAIDAQTLAELAAACPRSLARAAQRQTLSDVSASNPCLMALPELAWCTSLGTLVGYVKMRLIPERAELDGLAGLVKSADFARGQRWFTMSQPMRIATWMFRRPIRPATLYAVRRGLGYGAPPPSSQTETVRQP